MKTQFYDLSFDTLDDGTIRLEQRDYVGESVLVDLHPAQLEHIARSVLPSTPNGRIATLERRLCWMRSRFEECHAALPSDMYERCPEASEFYAWLMASIDVSSEFCADFPNVTSNALASPQEAAPLPLGDGDCQPSDAGRDDGLSGQRNADLFSDGAGGEK